MERRRERKRGKEGKDEARRDGRRKEMQWRRRF
jgi:hypothetical protein